MNYADYQVTIQITERLLGCSPANTEVYREWVANDPRDPSKGAPSPEKEREEIESLPGLESLPVEDEVKPLVTVFPRCPKGRIHLWDYQIKGHLKESGNILKEQLGISALRDKVDNFVYVSPRRVFLKRNGADIVEPDGFFKRPLRAMTMQGPRTALACSEYLDPPLTATFEIRLLEHKQLTEEVLVELLAFGELKGLLQWRNAAWGRFKVLEFKQINTHEDELTSKLRRKLLESVASGENAEETTVKRAKKKATS